MARSETRIAVPTAVLLLLALSQQGAARAELLRCTGPDGKTLFTDDKSQCPEAEPYKPAAVLQGTERQTPVEQSARRRAMGANPAAADGAAEQHWRELRESKQEELRRVDFERNELVSYVAWCNRGGSVIGRDDAGIKREIDCDGLRGKMAELNARKAELDEYLENGLADECRQAGCEPGWIR
jgi:hypothetical protein